MAARASVTLKKQGVQATPAGHEISSLQPLSLEDRIRSRAYEFYLERSGQEGTELDDWLKAESELTHTVEQNFHKTALDEAK